MTTSTSVSLECFQKTIVPLLQSKHTSGPALASAIQAFVKHTPVIDDEGNDVDVDTLTLEADSHPTEQAVTEDAVAAMVEKTLASLNAGRSAKPRITGGETQANQKSTSGFKGLGEFALAVHKASTPGGSIDPRLHTKGPSTYANEGAGGSGGFLVPQEWSQQLWQIVTGEESLLSRTNQIPTSRNSLSLPVNQTTPWGSSGVEAYWVDEAEQIGQTRPQFEYRNLRLHKLAALVPASDELLEDATALSAFIGAEAGRAIRYKADDALINGNGVGKPLGVLNSPALVTIDAEANQDPDTLVAENVAKMYARMPAPHINNAVWLINQDVLPQLLSMTLGNQQIYLPPNGMAGAPFGTLLGRPVLLSQHAQTLGNVGDIMFVDLSQYLALTKADGLDSASSMHLWFDYDITAFRFTFRIAGQPWLNAPIPPDNSSDPLSPFVTLAVRD